MGEVWLSTRQLAEHFDVSPSTVRQWRCRGTGPRGVRLGRGVRYAREDVDAWVAEQRAREERRRAGGAAR